MKQSRRQPTGLWWILTAVSGLFAGLTCWPVFAGKWFLYGDFGTLHIPFRTFVHQQMQNRVLPLWDPFSFGGLYIHGEGQAGLFHPFHWMTYPFLDGPLQIQLETTLVYLSMLAGCFVFFRRWSVSPSAALLGSIAFTFAGFSRMHLPHTNAMAVVAHMPWMLACIDHFFRDEEGRARWSLTLSLLNGSAILFGYPPFYFFTLIFQAWYVLWFYGEPHWWRRSIQWAAAVAGGVLLGAPQWLSTAVSAVGSSRADASYRFLLTGSWNPFNALSFINPGLFARGFMGDPLADEMNVYPGAGVLLLASYAVLCPSSRAKYPRAIRMLGALALFGLVLSLGRYGKVYELWRHLPGVRYFRVPVRYFCMVQFALAGLSALALDPFLNGKPQPAGWRRQSRPAALMGVGALITCGIGWARARTVTGFVVFPFLREDYFSNWPAILLGAVSVLVLCASYVLAVRNRGFWTRVTIVILLADLVWYAGSGWLTYPTGTPQDLVAEISSPGVPPGARVSPPDEGPNENPLGGKHKWYFSSWLTNIYALAGYRTTNGYTGLTPRGALPLESEDYKMLMGSQSIWRPESGVWQRVADPLPRVRLLTDLVQSAQPSRDLSRIDYRRQALVAEPHKVDPAATGTVQLFDKSTQEMRVLTDTSGPMLCVIAQRFHTGWKAKSEDGEVALFPVYGDLTGFVAAAGHHSTELKFAPADVSAGLWLAGLGALVSALSAMLAGRAILVKNR